MLKPLKINKSLIKNFSLVIIFALLSFSILKDLSEIVAVSTTKNVEYVPIMMYHQISKKNLGQITITTEEFESDLKFLQDNNYTTITMKDLINYVYEGIPLPSRPIMLTFDDAYLTTYTTVYPLLKKYDCKIVLSIIGKSTDDFTNVGGGDTPYSHLTWEQINEMIQSGHAEIQNHTYNMHKISQKRYGCYQNKSENLEEYTNNLSKDLLELQARTKEMLDYEPNTFTYPYGKYNNTTESIVKDLGFKATLSCNFGINAIRAGDKDALFSLKRIGRHHRANFAKLITDGMATLKYLDED